MLFLFRENRTTGRAHRRTDRQTDGRGATLNAATLGWPHYTSNINVIICDHCIYVSSTGDK